MTVVAPGVLGNDTDLNGDNILVATHSNPTNGSLMMWPDGGFAYTPTLSFFDTDTFTYTAMDTDSAVAYWPFSAGSGITATDMTGNGHDGILLSGATFNSNTPPTTIVNPYAVTFDGVDDMVAIPDSLDLNTGLNYPQRTVSAWFNVADVNINANKQVIWEEGGSFNGLNLYVFDGALYGGHWNESDGWDGTWISSTAIISGQWHHVAIVISGTATMSADALQVYLDGNLLDTVSGTYLNGHASEITLGGARGSKFADSGDFNSNGHYFGGQIDEVWVFNQALTGGEVATLANGYLDSALSNSATVTIDVEGIIDCFVESTGDNVTDFVSVDASAVQDAVNAAASDDTIKVAGTCAGVQSQNGVIQTVHISQNLTIQGGYTDTNWLAASDSVVHPTVLDAEENGRVVYIANGVTVDLNNLTLQNGYTTGDGGGIYAGSVLTLTNTLLRYNWADNVGGGLFVANNNGLTTYISNTQLISNSAWYGGGGFYTWRPITIVNTLISQNVTNEYGAGGTLDTGSRFLIQNSDILSNTNLSFEGGGLYIAGTAGGTIQGSRVLSNTALGSDGGGLYLEYNNAVVTVTDSDIGSNQSAQGGGINLYDSHMIIENTTIHNNNAIQKINGYGGEGGGISLDRNSVITISQSTIAYNVATGEGGGIHAEDETISTLDNSTISHNQANIGGGIYGIPSSSRSTLITLTHTTLYSNTATQGGGIYLKDTTDGNAGIAQITFQNSIIASNNAGDCATENGWELLDSTLGYNLDSDGSCILGGGAGNITDDPLLGGLADNGGDTPTHALLDGGSALDTIPLVNCVLPTDQRGIDRPQNAACDVGAYERNVRSITVTIVGNGSVSSDPAGISCESDCDETYDYGTVVTLTAVISPNSTFTGWTGSAITTTNPITLTMDEAKDVTATFTLDTYTLTVNLDGNGSISSDPAGIDCDADCSETYEYGTVVTLTAATTISSTFTGWSRNCSGTDSCIVTVDAAKNVTATFSTVQYTLTTATDGNGAGSVSLDPAGETYDYGTAVTVTHNANTGSTFTGWSGNCSGTSSCVVTMDAAKSVTATFTLNNYTLTLNNDGSGSTAVDPAGSDFLYGTVVTITATPDNGAFFTGWMGDDNSANNPLQITIDGHKTLTATFDVIPPVIHLLDVTVVGNGVVTPTSGSYISGTMVSLTAVSDVNYSFIGWTGSIITTTNPLILTMDETKNITATFAQDTYTLTVNLDGNGSVSSDPAGIDCDADCSETYEYGTVVTLTAVSTISSTFTGWTGSIITTTNPLVLTIDEAKDVTATFTVDTYDLTVNLDGNGSVSSDPAGIDCDVDCSETYAYGTVVTLTAVADAGTTFTGWTGSTITTTNPITLTMDEAKTVTATFNTTQFYIFLPVILK